MLPTLLRHIIITTNCDEGVTARLHVDKNYGKPYAMPIDTDDNKPQIFTSSNPDEFWLDERIYIRELMNAPEEPALSLARFRVPAGSTTQLHSLTITEWYVMESGTGILEIDGQEMPIKAGDCTKINAGQSQRVINKSDEELVFQSICTPRWTPECYKNLEKTGKNNES